MEYGLIGEHLGHSFSPDIHRMIDNYKYELREIAPNDLDAFMTAKDFRAINVTIPYKQAVIPYLDEIDDAAARIGAVNCIVNKDGKLIGHNTDYDGLKALILRNKLTLADSKVLILGTGGTSHTASVVATDLGADKIIHVSRTKNDNTITYEEAISLHNDADYIINTTPVGMYPKIDGCPIDIKAFHHIKGVIDVIFNPLRSNLVIEAQNMGIPAEGGLYMLVVQAIKAAEYFTGHEYDKQLADSIFSTLRKNKENIVLIGMPGCGKTTLSSILAKQLEYDLVDTDQLIIDREKCEITEIFSSHGEEYFRQIETECIKDICTLNKTIIATGGGSAMRWENILALKRNGRIFFIDRPLDALIPTSDRPLADNRSKIEALFDKRYPTYTAVCDVQINAKGDVNSVVDKILTER